MLGTYSIWPIFACIGVLLCLASSPWFAAADAPPNSGPMRLVPLDGLRGFLALAVFFHHTANYHDFVLNGLFGSPSRFYGILGEVGVALFFMVTGYLFWSRMIRDQGRPDWIRFYIGRVFRIGPLYLFAVAAMLAIVLSATGFTLKVPIGRLGIQVFYWLGLGLLPRPDVNGVVGTTLILTGVTWTLRWEWAYYFTLPMIAWVTRYPRMHLPFALVGLTCCVAGLAIDRVSQDQAYPALFFAGMACASLNARGHKARLSDALASLLVIVLLAVTVGWFTTAYSAGPVVLLALAFYLIASGCTLFGLLLLRPALRLGNISYGIYLLQGLVFSIVLRPSAMKAMFLASPARHWLLSLACAAILVAFATVAHAGIERTGIDIGKRLSTIRVARQPG